MCAFFAVDLATGEQMIQSIGQMQTEVSAMLRRLNDVDRTVNLGDLQEAQAVAEFNQMVASGGAQSARAVLTQFSESLDQAVVALQQGMANYREVEAATEQRQRELQEAEAQRPVSPRGGPRAV
jgi:hypothetical protein